MITTDGSITDLSRESYREAEEKVIQELKSIGKPFVVLVNSKKPYSEEAKATAEELQKKYQIPAMPVNCEQLKEEDICHISGDGALMRSRFARFVSLFPMVEMLPRDHRIKQDLLIHIRGILDGFGEIRDCSVRDCAG